MPELTKIGAQTLRRIRETLTKTAELEKRAADAELENDIYRRVLGLVGQGHIDPESAVEKVAEFKTDVRQLDIFEAAVSFSTDHTKIGSAVDDVVDEASGGETSEARYSRRLRDVLGDSFM